MRHRTTLGLALAGMLGLGVPAEAQHLARRALAPHTGRLTVDGFFSRSRLRLGNERADLGGLGARVLWSLAPARVGEPTDLRSRLAIGGFYIGAPESDRAGDADVRSRHFGGQADLRLPSRRLMGAFEPVVSLSVGVLDAREQRSLASHRDRLRIMFARDAYLPVGPLPRAADERAELRSVTVGPAFGLRLGLAPDLAIRGDVRDVIVLRDGGRHNLELTTGLSLVL